MSIGSDFVETVWDYYAKHERDLPWRQPESDGSFDPYKILVSEIMLQQTQVARVTQKYQEFLSVFPDVQSLAAATLGDVVKLWQGLGYNRRAKFLWQAAQAVNKLGVFPKDQKELVKLPGVGVNTAGAILAYAYNRPVVFVETNIRSVYIHHFFQDVIDVDDKELLPLIEKTLDREHPREWYWALMDYGSFLKSEHGNAARASKHYAKQSRFEGSKRQVRGQVLKALVGGTQSRRALGDTIADERLETVLTDLIQEGLITKDKQSYHLA